MDTVEQEGLLARIRDIMDGDYDVRDVEAVPTPQRVNLGKMALKCDVIAFSIDLRDSTAILDQHRRQTAGKIHKAFLHAVGDWVRSSGGQIRSYTGDGLLAFWPYADDNVEASVAAAIGLNDFLRENAASAFEKYRPIDFGIGLASGSVVVFKAGIEGTPRDSDLVFIGDCVNAAVKMAKLARFPRPIWITQDMHERLPVHLQLGDPDAILFDEPFWEHESMDFQEGSIDVWQFDCRQVVNLEF